MHVALSYPKVQPETTCEGDVAYVSETFFPPASVAATTGKSRITENSPLTLSSSRSTVSFPSWIKSHTEGNGTEHSAFTLPNSCSRYSAHLITWIVSKCCKQLSTEQLANRDDGFVKKLTILPLYSSLTSFLPPHQFHLGSIFDVDGKIEQKSEAVECQTFTRLTKFQLTWRQIKETPSFILIFLLTLFSKFLLFEIFNKFRDSTCSTTLYVKHHFHCETIFDQPRCFSFAKTLLPFFKIKP